MEQNTVTINQLIAQILDEMRRTDYSESTIWRYYQPAMGQFRKYYGQTGQAVYSPEITDEYISLNKESMNAARSPTSHSRKRGMSAAG